MSAVTDLIRPESALAWELRGHWAARREIVLRLHGGRVRGFVEHVSATGAYAIVDPVSSTLPSPEPWEPPTLHVPLGLVLSVRRPHFHEDGPLSPVRERRRTEADLQLSGQGTLGEWFRPPATARADYALARAVEMMLPPQTLRLIAALDRAQERVNGRGVATSEVADEIGHSDPWTSRRLRELAVIGLVQRSRGPYGRVRWRLKKKGA